METTHHSERCNKEVLVYINTVPYKKVLIPAKDDYVKFYAAERLEVIDYRNTNQPIQCKSFVFPIKRTNDGWIADVFSQELELDGDGTLRLKNSSSAQIAGAA